MLLLASTLRGVRRLVIAATAVALVAIAWTTVLRFVAAPAPGRLSELLLTLGTRLLAPFDPLSQPTTLSNGGTFAWTSLAAMLAYVLVAAVMTRLLILASDKLMALNLAKQGPSLEELREQAPAPADKRGLGLFG